MVCISQRLTENELLMKKRIDGTGCITLTDMPANDMIFER